MTKKQLEEKNLLLQEQLTSLHERLSETEKSKSDLQQDIEKIKQDRDNILNSLARLNDNLNIFKNNEINQMKRLEDDLINRFLKYYDKLLAAVSPEFKHVFKDVLQQFNLQEVQYAHYDPSVHILIGDKKDSNLRVIESGYYKDGQLFKYAKVKFD